LKEERLLYFVNTIHSYFGLLSGVFVFRTEIDIFKTRKEGSSKFPEMLAIYVDSSDISREIAQR
jgi:hypothetical protein